MQSPEKKTIEIFWNHRLAFAASYSDCYRVQSSILDWRQRCRTFPATPVISSTDIIFANIGQADYIYFDPDDGMRNPILLQMAIARTPSPWWRATFPATGMRRCRSPVRDWAVMAAGNEWDEAREMESGGTEWERIHAMMDCSHNAENVYHTSSCRHLDQRGALRRAQPRQPRRLLERQGSGYNYRNAGRITSSRCLCLGASRPRTENSITKITLRW